MEDIKWRIAALLLVVIAGCTALFLFNQNQSIVDAATVSKVNYDVYVPEQIPDEYKLEGKASESNGIISYSIDKKNGKKVTFTLQQLPAGFDMTKMIGDSKMKAIDTELGSMYDMSAGGSSRFMISTGSTLIFITSSINLESNFVRDLVNTMRKIS